MSEEEVQSRYPTGPPACHDDPDCTPWIESPTSLMMIILYAYIGVVLVAGTLFAIHRGLKARKKSKHKNRQREDSDGGERQDGDRPEPQTRSKSRSSATMFSDMDKLPKTSANRQNESMNDLMGDGKGDDMGDSSLNMFTLDGVDKHSLAYTLNEYGMMLKPYRNTFMGQIVWVLACSMCVMWFVTLGIITWDCYAGCQLHGIDALCFYGNYRVFGSYAPNSNYFFAWWCGSLVWFVFWLWNKNKIRNWCRDPCTLAEAQYMWIWVKDEEEVLIANRTRIVVIWYKMIEFFAGELENGHDATIEVQHLKDGTPFFIHEGSRYVYVPGVQSYIPPSIDLGRTFSDLHELSVGLTSSVAADRMRLMGPNEIPFKPEAFWSLTAKEFFGFFYLYQLSMYSIQIWNAYITYAAVNLSVVILSGFLNVYIVYKNEHNIAKLTVYTTKCEVLRDGQWDEKDSTELVPGDMVKIRSDWLLPCDLVLLEGACVVNESGLTGESMPVQKVALPNEQGKQYDAHSTGVKNTLFASTTVLQAGSGAGDHVVAVVTGTGINTSKGDLVSTILFPQRMLFKYDEELSVAVTLLGVYGFVCFILSMLFQAMNGSTSGWITKWAFAAGVIVQCMNPLLPVALKVGTVRAAQRLNNKGVFALNPTRISISGKIRVFCFDKTGTLTKEGLDFLGAQQVHNKEFGEMIGCESRDMSERTMECLATCHAVAKFNDMLVGNQVEVKMFSATGWNLIEKAGMPPQVVGPANKTLTIVKRFEFDHGLQLMSVLVKDSHGDVHCFCKGSFEKVEGVCKPDTVPSNYIYEAKEHAINGGYVLGISHSNLGPLREDQISHFTRRDVEKNLELLGLIVFRNELKSDTRQAIIKIKEGDVRPVMITGDNAHTGFFIAKQAALINEGKQVLLAETDKKTNEIGWKRLGSAFENDTPMQTKDVYNCPEVNSGEWELAVAGANTYDTLLNNGDIADLLSKIRIFARMSPEGKVSAVEMHKKAGIITGMCGDGGNDAGALRAAHAGMALSDAEASIVSPFTSKSKSVQSVVDLLLDGRACLHTSFAMYKFLVANGLVLSLTKLIILWKGVLVCIFGYLMIDLAATLTLGYTMVLARPPESLKQIRPTSSLLGPITVCSVLGVVLIDFAITVICLLYIETLTNFVPWPSQIALGRTWWYLSDNWEASILYFTQMGAYLTNALAFSLGSYFRLEIYRNIWLMIDVAILYVIQLCFILMEPNAFVDAMHVASIQFNRVGTDNPIWQEWQSLGNPTSPAMSFWERFVIAVLLLVATALAMCYQRFVIDGPVGRFFQKRAPSDRPKLNP